MSFVPRLNLMIYIQALINAIYNAFKPMIEALSQYYIMLYRTMLFNKKYRKGVAQLPALIIGIIVVMVVGMIGVLLGGVFSGTISDTFTQNNLTGTTWDTLRQTVEQYSTTGLSLSFIGIIVAAAAAVLAIVMWLQRER